jgi:aromatic ring-cleaving dioxygenase
MDLIEADRIADYHVHIYFAPDERETAVALREEIGRRFDVLLGRVWDKPIGPHPKAMFQVTLQPETFPKLVPWLMMNHHGLSMLIHPESGNELEDHRDNALWLGEKLQLDLAALD